KKPLQLLSHASPDLAIARGAAYFAGLTQQSSARVQSPSPQSLYLSLEQADGQLLYFCLIPRAWPREKPARLELPGLRLRLGQDVGFRLFASNDAKGDHIAKEVPYHSSWRALPQLSTRLQHNSRQAKEIPVSLEAIIRETGLLELRCLADDDSGLSWLLDFSLETEAPLSLQIGSQTSPIDAKQWLAVENLLDKSFGNLGNPSGISSLTRQIEEIIGKREDWTIPTLRALWKPLSEAMFRRQRDTDTESAWYYLAGYALRPGFGSSLDGERIQSLWRLFDSGPLKNKMDKKLEAQWYLMWRRVAGGLNRAQQNRLLDRILPQLRKEAEAGPELIRLAACLERADSNKRIQVGRALLQHIGAGRRRGEILTDLDEAWRQHFVERLKEAKASDELIRPVLEPIASDEHLLRELFGESLPLGLILKN
ncbi:MAG: hypothetical protein NTX25_13830, partial [Proteobacteria bacterium]|nr:hypothetical protein [Pseudomonadota bacterium]